MLLLVHVQRASGLPTTGSDGTVDTFCEVSLGSIVEKTSTKIDDADPVFNEYFLLYVVQRAALRSAPSRARAPRRRSSAAVVCARICSPRLPPRPPRSPIPEADADDEERMKLKVTMMDKDMDGGEDVLLGYIDIGFPPEPVVNAPWEHEFTLTHEHITVKRNKKEDGAYIVKVKKGVDAPAHTPDTKFPLGTLTLAITWLSVNELQSKAEEEAALRAQLGALGKELAGLERNAAAAAAASSSAATATVSSVTQRLSQAEALSTAQHRASLSSSVMELTARAASLEAAAEEKDRALAGLAELQAQALDEERTSGDAAAEAHEALLASMRAEHEAALAPAIAEATQSAVEDAEASSAEVLQELEVVTRKLHRMQQRLAHNRRCMPRSPMRGKLSLATQRRMVAKGQGTLLLTHVACSAAAAPPAVPRLT
jgi:hypothetical protein